MQENISCFMNDLLSWRPDARVKEKIWAFVLAPVHNCLSNRPRKLYRKHFNKTTADCFRKLMSQLTGKFQWSLQGVGIKIRIRTKGTWWVYLSNCVPTLVV
ncbi:hypothetical protein AB3S75_033711 [Citrus x aurantiifolia]